MNILAAIFLAACEDLLRPLSGPLGVRLRRVYYRRRLRCCGNGLVVGPGVYIQNPGAIEVGDNVWIDTGAVLIAGPSASVASSKTRPGCNPGREDGILHIGDNAHIGVRTIIQSHAGVTLGRNVTTSANVAIYSLSNDPYNCQAGTRGCGESAPGYVSSEIRIGDNVWLALNAVVVGGHIGSDSFAKPFALLATDFPANSVLEGNPASRSGERFRIEAGPVPRCTDAN